MAIEIQKYFIKSTNYLSKHFKNIYLANTFSSLITFIISLKLQYRFNQIEGHRLELNSIDQSIMYADISTLMSLGFFILITLIAMLPIVLIKNKIYGLMISICLIATFTSFLISTIELNLNNWFIISFFLLCTSILYLVLEKANQLKNDIVAQK